MARTSFVRPALLAASVLLVFVFLVSHPYLEGAGLCDDGGCPPATQLSHATHAEPSSSCPAAVLAAAGAAAPAFFAFVGCRRASRQRRPLEAYLPPEPPPPRLPRALLSR
ncbi:hypothetical protein GBA63_19100 [Rubrobacter tropicus]|uniref:Uncharacterized protein n=1 Tax=Rubrobacter tropicus TaxID=2653851 RepID=A0A6G8QDE1_9ACTN|nr:hypothetical protein [Rubrobacter tropicus]QIN84515.1 hypothetical protein GBA63_19100 [Rubrobacter tropicus]